MLLSLSSIGFARTSLLARSCPDARPRHADVSPLPGAHTPSSFGDCLLYVHATSGSVRVGRNVPSTGLSAGLPLSRIQRGALLRPEPRRGATGRCSPDTR